jgi:NDP-sugar pyrophosphorylase family protein
MIKYNTLITAAAYTAGTFKAAGFDGSRNTQKFEGVALILSSINSFYNPEGFLVVAINSDEEAEGLGSKVLISQGFPAAQIVEVSSKSRGALATALLSLKGIPMDEPLLIASGDSFLTKPIDEVLLEEVFDSSAALILSFKSKNPRWSYIAINKSGDVVEVAEKLVISELATTGTFLFKKASYFVEAAEWVLLNNASTDGRFFVSTALNYLISRGLLVSYARVERTEYFNLSLPADFLRQAP